MAEKPSVSPARMAAYRILMRVQEEGSYASELLHAAALDSLSAADRGLATELVMGVLRWRSRLDAALAAHSWQPLRRVDPEVLTALRMAAYQVGFLDRVPARAAVHESVELVKQARKRSAVPYANAVLRKLRPEAFRAAAPPPGATVNELALHYAHPAWMVERWVNQFGVARAQRILAHNQQVPATSIRLLDASAETELLAAGLTLEPGALMANARRVLAGDVATTAACRDGRVHIQDEASQLVAVLVGRGQRLLDCCAAPGGKTAALAARNPHSRLVAAELHAHRSRALRERLEYRGNVEVITADAASLPLSGGFDRVLADVPCSGTGTLARHPEIKWRLQPESLPALRELQVRILNAALDQLAPGGRGVYSTCSLEPEEDEQVVEAVLRARSDIRLIPAAGELQRIKEEGELAWPDSASLLAGDFVRTLPGIHPADGFFAAVLERTRG